MLETIPGIPGTAISSEASSDTLMRDSNCRMPSWTFRNGWRTGHDTL
jgi:hypothetical protein